MRRGLWLLVGMWLVACGDDATPECTATSDCAGASICVNGACVEPFDGSVERDGAADDGAVIDAIASDAGNGDAQPLDASQPDGSVIPPCPTGSTYEPSSAEELGNAANAGRTAMITTSFDCDGCTLAAGQTLIAAGGVIAGTSIDLNGACIQDSFAQLFASGARFSEVYDRTRLSPELFGATADGTTDDDDAIDALIVNAALAVGRPEVTYVKNRESVYSRSGPFDWDLQGATVTTVDGSALSHGSGTENQNKALFDFQGPSPSIHNGEFDGGRLASRLFRVEHAESFSFEALHVHDYHSPEGAYARAVAFFLKVAPEADGFTTGVVRDTLIERIGGASNGIANDAPFGVSKALWVSIADNGPGTITLDRVTVDDIYGDDAEGFYNSPGYGSSYDYQASELNIIVEDSTFRACQRRALKINASNITVRNSVLESASNDWAFSGAQAAMLQVFSIRSGQPVENVRLLNNEIRVVGEARNVLFGINDATDCTIEGNTFESNKIIAQSAIIFAAFGTQGGLYSGDLSNTVVFRNNEITNAYLELSQVYDPIDGGPVISGNRQRLVLDGDNPGVYWAAFRMVGTSGQSREFTIEDHELTCEITSAAGLGLFGGVFNTQGVEPQSLTLRNVDVTYTGGVAPMYPFGYTGRDSQMVNVDGSNLIQDCDIEGASGTGALVVTGSDRSVRIENSFGDGTTPLTVR